MKVIVAENCGFCHGVNNAITMAEKVLKQEKDVYSLGPIIHNNEVVDRLTKSGLKTVNSIEEIHSGTVLIRSHGAAPAVIDQLKDKGIKIVDATCILVKTVQRIAGQMTEQGYKVVIIGDEKHPEVQAVMGCAGEKVIVIGDESDLHKLPENDKLGIICQTTQSYEYFSKTLQSIVQTSFNELKIVNTLCKEATKRQQSAVELCRRVDVMFVLGSYKSANTHKLAELCKQHNSQTFHLQNWTELDKSTFFQKEVAGVTAGASTPEWVISEFVINLKKL
ncbi:MAG: 4-hydroxy-3-methylbut-2-enyl diphosphate reductase [Sedimentisphaerales bacterium]|nr:4-hydroxy-3-methylbut-2-enyl diphosphate reductase [Sedimentisphaerales bacterium]